MGLICPLWSFSVALLITLKRSQVEPCGNFTKRTQKEVTHCVINSIFPHASHICTETRVQVFQMSNASFTFAVLSLLYVPVHHATDCKWSRVPNQAAVPHTNTHVCVLTVSCIIMGTLLNHYYSVTGGNFEKFGGIWSSSVPGAHF